MSGEKTITHSYHTATIQLYTLTGNVLMLQEIFRNFREINGPVSTLQAIVPTSVQFETRREGGATNRDTLNLINSQYSYYSIDYHIFTYTIPSQHLLQLMIAVKEG